ncbi:hypothetical protein [Tissierella sp. Yu-01]|uniref:hypothetical protein n=1 Tax=Tissierella sp. Yu-01 TaxID=3035694 RepID=UPI00240D20A8|nr:hypothetical protein [Tissierella sp. Yu-01]WFA10352.1 hypothetical protein P3962_07310 [Tissierella sp. Yu-01]
MDIKVIEAALRDYKRKKSIIETTLLRIDQFKEAIKDPYSFSGVLLGTSREPGMPSSNNGGGSSVEIAIEDKEKAIELLHEWINDDKSRIYHYQIEKEQIDAALGALTKQQRYIIECKYFEDMFWRDIEINFNDKFRGQNYITISGIRKMNSDALNMLADILEPYYNRFKIKK